MLNLPQAMQQFEIIITYHYHFSSSVFRYRVEYREGLHPEISISLLHIFRSKLYDNGLFLYLAEHHSSRSDRNVRPLELFYQHQ